MSSRTLAAHRDEALDTGPRICLHGAAPDTGNRGLTTAQWRSTASDSGEATGTTGRGPT